MSLSKQLILYITTLLIILLAGTFFVIITNTATFLEEQLESHAQDTATSLGLSLSSVADPDDPSSMETMINAVFDRGYYLTVELTDMDDKQLYVRNHPAMIEGVPLWFVQIVELKAAVADSLVQAGWSPLGSLHVQSHPGTAYSELWETAIKLLSWFVFSAIVSLLLAYFALKSMLRPLKEMEKQAEAIVKKEYLLQDNLPSTVEFRQVVSGMNAMVTKMKAMFDRDADMAEKLQKMAYQDSTTGMSNRLHFEMLVETLLDPQLDASAGMLCLIRLDGYKEINDKLGYIAGDKMMLGMADSLKQYMKTPQAVYARLNGTELIAVLPGANRNLIKKNASLLANNFLNILESIHADKNDTFISVAATAYQPGDKRGALLAKLDYAIEESLKLGHNKAYLYETKEENSSSNDNWDEIISSAMSENRFTLFQQAAYSASCQIHNRELLVRMIDSEDTIRSAGYFMPAIEQHNRVLELDQRVITLAVDYLKNNQTPYMVAINLGQAMIETPEAVEWLLNAVKDVPSEFLAFELSESIVTAEGSQAKTVIKQLKGLGISVGLDHFGSNFSDMHYLQDMKPDYIKLNAAFSKSIDKDEQTQSYVSSLAEMAKSLDIDIIAMAVENETQIALFESLNVRYFQGYHFGAPTPLT